MIGLALVFSLSCRRDQQVSLTIDTTACPSTCSIDRFDLLLVDRASSAPCIRTRQSIRRDQTTTLARDINANEPLAVEVFAFCSNESCAACSGTVDLLAQAKRGEVTVALESSTEPCLAPSTASCGNEGDGGSDAFVSNDGSGDADPHDDASGVNITEGYVVSRAPSFSTTSREFVDVPGGIVSFQPESPNQAWLVLISADLSSSAGYTSMNNAQARYLINGIEAGSGATGASLAGMAGSWQHFAWVTGTSDLQRVSVQIRDLSAEATISQLHIVAFPLPSAADLQVLELDQTTVRGDTWQVYPGHELVFTPSRPGDYLIMAVANMTEAPATNSINLRIRDSSNYLWPVNGVGADDRLRNNRQLSRSYFLARLQPLTAGEQRYAIELKGSRFAGDEMTFESARMVAFRVDGFERVESDFEIGLDSSSASTDTIKGEVTTVEPPRQRGYILIRNMVMMLDKEATSPIGSVSFANSTTNTITYRYGPGDDQSSAILSFSQFDALSTSTPFTLRNAYALTKGTVAIHSKESVIISLRLP